MLRRELARRDLIVIGVALCVAFLTFAPVLTGFFLGDDFFLVKGALGASPFDILTFGGIFFRPASAVSFWVDAHLWGLHPTAFHATNLVLHAVAAFAVLKIGESLDLPSSAALAGAALFLLAPAHSEAVSWIACRMDVLAAATGFTSIWLSLEAVRGRAWLRIPALVLMTCALLAKESAGTLPLIIAWIEISASRTARAAIPLLLLLAYAIARRGCMGQWVGGYGHVPGPLDMAAKVVPYTLRSLLGPLPGQWLPVSRPLFDIIDRFFDWVRAEPRRLIVAVTTLVAASAGVVHFFARRREWLSPPVPFLAGAYLVALLPALTVGVSYFTVGGERFLYFSSGPAFLLLSAVLHRALAPRRRFGPVLVGALVFSVVSLEHSLGAWRAAGKLSENLLGQIATAAATRPIVLTNVPNDLRGAHVFINGLPEALALFHPGSKTVQLLTKHTVFSQDEPVNVSCAKDGLDLRLGDPRSWVTDPPEAAGRNAVHLAAPPAGSVWAYSAGKLVELTCAR
jgi:hypothetical protein